MTTLAMLERTNGQLPTTAVVDTGRGRHYWFAHPGGTVRNSAGRLGPGLDIRGDGGYVIAPPSSHITGRRYRWGTARPIAPLPDWILELGRAHDHPPPAVSRNPLPRPRRTGPWARAALASELQRVRSSNPGSRNHTLNRAAFALGQLVGSGYLANDQVQPALEEAGVSSGLMPREVRATVVSGLKAGVRFPRQPRAPDLHPL